MAVAMMVKQGDGMTYTNSLGQKQTYYCALCGITYAAIEGTNCHCPKCLSHLYRTKVSDINLKDIPF